FYGRDSFSRHQALAALKASLDTDAMLQSNTSVLDGRQVSPEEVVTVCSTVPFLGAQRLVIVEGLLARFEGEGRGRGRRRTRKGDGGDALGPWRALADHVDHMPPTTTLVLVDEDVTDANPLLKELGTKAQVRRFPPLKQKDVPAWVQGRAGEIGLTISVAAVKLLAELVGNDLWALASELDKLAAYADGQRLDEAEVRALVSAAREVTVFPLVDAIVEGRAAQATKLLHKLMAQGAEATYLLHMILRQYRHLALAREMLEQGAGAAAIGERLNLRNQFALERLLQQAGRYDRARLLAAYRRLVDADAAIKRGVYSDELALELLVQDLAGPDSSKGAHARVGLGG
ncbi:MAG: DNA polymerase III subunit delta, partial [Dehalococcoidia bacterium]